MLNGKDCMDAAVHLNSRKQLLQHQNRIQQSFVTVIKTLDCVARTRRGSCGVRRRM